MNLSTPHGALGTTASSGLISQSIVFQLHTVH